MPALPSPTARSRRLRQELRRLREQNDMSPSEAAYKLEWPLAKISQIEAGQARAHADDIPKLLDLYGVADHATRDTLLRLVREGRRRNWWIRDTDPLTSGRYTGLEAGAAALRSYEPMFIPELLQTEDYARAVIGAGQPRPDPGAADRRLATRLARQEILTRPGPPDIWAVLDESAVSRPVGGPGVMRAQLQQLIEASTCPGIQLTLQVLPLTAGAHPGMSGAFTVLSFPALPDPPMVYLQTATDDLYLDEHADVERYTLRFNHLVAQALGPGESRTMMARLAERMT